MKKEKTWQTKPIDNKEKTPQKEPTLKEAPKKEQTWAKKTGELAVDVYGTEKDIIIQAPIAGIKRDDLEIITEKDMVIIKGSRNRQQEEEVKDFYTQECFYGDFRREVILPEETDPSRINANIEEGILTIRIPKIEREKRRKVDI